MTIDDLNQKRSVRDEDRVNKEEEEDDKKEEEQVAQGQYVVSDTRCPALHDCEFV